MSSPVTSVPLLDLQAQYQPIRDEMLAAITRVCDSQRFIMGPEVEGLERELAAMLEVQEAVGVSSGTDALLAAMMALGHRPGRRGGHDAPTRSSPRRAASRVSARSPSLVDIDPVTYNIDPAAIAAAMTPRTKAVMPVHLYGCSADMDADPRDGGPRRRRGHRGRRAGDRRPLPRPPGRRARHVRLLLVLPEQEPRRLRRRRLRHDQRPGARAPRCASCGTTAWSRSTSTTSSAPTSGSTRSRRRCCA